MKKITLLLLIGLSLASCSKKNDPKPASTNVVVPVKTNTITPTPTNTVISVPTNTVVLNKMITFSSTGLSSNGYCSINGELKSLSIAYNVKSGDICKIYDSGIDIIHPDMNLYNSKTGVLTYSTPGYTEEGETSGYIIYNDGMTASIVKQFEGAGDTNLTFIIL